MTMDRTDLAYGLLFAACSAVGYVIGGHAESIMDAVTFGFAFLGVYTAGIFFWKTVGVR